MTITDSDIHPPEVINHHLIRRIETDPYQMLGLAPNVSYEAVKEHAAQLLEDMWDQANDNDNGADPNDVYLLALERLVALMYSDLNYVIRLICPKTIENQLIDVANRFGNASVAQKLVFNILFHMESSGIDYDYDDRLSYIRSTNIFSAFRAEWDQDLDQTVKLYDDLPDHWKPAVNRFIERSVLYLYGPDPESDEPS